MKQCHEAGLEPNYDPKTGKVKGKNEMIPSEYHKLDDVKNEKLSKDEEKRIRRMAFFGKDTQKMQKNLRFLIYRLQDPKMAEKYMSFGSILKEKNQKKV